MALKWRSCRDLLPHVCRVANAIVVAVDVREVGAELTQMAGGGPGRYRQVPRVASVCSPRRQCRAVSADVRENGAENAQANAIQMPLNRRDAKIKAESFFEGPSAANIVSPEARETKYKNSVAESGWQWVTFW